MDPGKREEIGREKVQPKFFSLSECNFLFRFWALTLGLNFLVENLHRVLAKVTSSMFRLPMAI